MKHHPYIVCCEQHKKLALDKSTQKHPISTVEETEVSHLDLDERMSLHKQKRKGLNNSNWEEKAAVESDRFLTLHQFAVSSFHRGCYFSNKTALSWFAE